MSLMNVSGLILIRNLINAAKNEVSKKISKCPNYMQLSNDLSINESESANIINSMTVYENFLSDSDEKSIIEEIEPYMRQLKYEFDHWDNAIHGYRETERGNWNKRNSEILGRVRQIAFPPGVGQLKYVHILDLDRNGYIKPHIDAVRFCGDTIAGLSLLSDSVMRLVHDDKKNLYADVLLKRRSLYVMTKSARLQYTHEILKTGDSFFKGSPVFKDRRISVICRNEPDPRNV